MKKLFEIPIYAFSPLAFSARVKKYKESFIAEYQEKHVRVSDSRMRQLLYLVCHPFQLWDYNHIVGFIVILSDGVDVFFDLYLQAHSYYKKTRYHWRSTQKWLLENQSVTGYHFRLNERDTSEMIRAKIRSWLDGMIKELVPSKYYVDREAFDRIDPMINYSSLIKR